MNWEHKIESEYSPFASVEAQAWIGMAITFFIVAIMVLIAFIHWTADANENGHVQMGDKIHLSQSPLDSLRSRVSVRIKQRAKPSSTNN